MSSRRATCRWFAFVLLGVVWLILPAAAAAASSISDHVNVELSASADGASERSDDQGILTAHTPFATASRGPADFAYDAAPEIAPSRIGGLEGLCSSAVGLEGGVAFPTISPGYLYDLSSFFVAPRWTDEAVEAMYDACRRNSFLPGTAVLMADGSTKPIEDVEIGDWVWAHDPETGETGPRRVVATIVGDGQKQLVDIQVAGDTLTATGGHPFWVDDEGQWVDAGDLVVGDHLLLADGSTTVVAAVDDRDTVTATDGHPFWVADDGAWIDAGDLEVGDRLLLANGQRTPITAIDERVAVQRVHNLTVDGIHTYYVQAGDEHVLVHNTGCTNIADLPDAAVRNLTTDETFAFQHLRDNHGLTRIEFREQIHAIKQAEGLPADFDVFFGPTGDVWNPSSGDLIGRLVHGG